MQPTSTSEKNSRPKRPKPITENNTTRAESPEAKDQRESKKPLPENEQPESSLQTAKVFIASFALKSKTFSQLPNAPREMFRACI